ncbi:diacylglycerol kinase catalytic domain protein, partial [Necator americanus]
EQKPRRILVLANASSNERHGYDDFTKNALPLLHLAGLQVDVIKADSEIQMEALAAAVDSQEADAIYVVGGDGTLGKVVTGILRNRKNVALPLGIFPGGYDNLSLRRLAPSVFVFFLDFRLLLNSEKFCLQEDEGLNTEPIYSVGDVGAGWFRHIEERRRKLWYFGALRRRWAYLWEMFKHFPMDMEAKMRYEEVCTGCSTCRPSVIFEPSAWRFWHILTGAPRYQASGVNKNYSEVINENCGRIHEVDMRGTDLIIENDSSEVKKTFMAGMAVELINRGNVKVCVNPIELIPIVCYSEISLILIYGLSFMLTFHLLLQDSACLRVRMGGTQAGRKGVLADGWRRCSTGRVGTSDNGNFYTTDLLAKAVSITFVKIPEFIHRLYVSSDRVNEVLEGKKVKIKTTDRRVEMYLPNAIRFDIDSL